MKAWLTSQIESSPSIQSILAAFQRLPLQKQRLLSLVLAVAFLLLIVKLLVMPIYQEYQFSVSRLAAAKADYALLVRHASELSSSTKSKETFLDRSSTQLRSLVNDSLKKAKLSPDVISREGKSQLRVGVSDVPFQSVADWLNSLAKQKVKIDSLQLQALSPGMVSLSVSLD
ncbi:General secretion pathway, M protein [Marinomonas spartinae]|uniref:type II secretion system protein GspM n=1 Tax=Marinomonas spartinae TaxID=1792290 RepID=UPI000808DBB2|nr:type II secretion system protein GspM [Marinomonas spartinae]SBS35287.1 General secretion pathway, M protein [Marinomonas spartinae]